MMGLNTRVEVIEGLHKGKRGKIIEVKTDRENRWLVEFDNRRPD